MSRPYNLPYELDEVILCNLFLPNKSECDLFNFALLSRILQFRFLYIYWVPGNLYREDFDAYLFMILSSIEVTVQSPAILFSQEGV